MGNTVYTLQDPFNGHPNLKPFKDYLAKISYDMPSTLSYKEAKKLFEATFNSNRIIYNDDKYNIDDFYLGTLDLCTGFYNDKLSYSDIHRINEQINIPSELLLSKSYNGLGMFFGEKKEIDGKLYFRDYTVFHTIYMQKLDGLYSIHDYQIYNPNETELKECNSIARINRPLREEFDCRGIEYEDEISIPKVLKLQVKNRI